MHPAETTFNVMVWKEPTQLKKNEGERNGLVRVPKIPGQCLKWEFCQSTTFVRPVCSCSCWSSIKRLQSRAE